MSHRFAIGLLLGCAVWWGDPPVFAQQEAAPQGQVLTFEDCQNKVLAAYPALKRQQAKVEEAIARKALAVSGLFPRVQGLGSVSTTDDQVLVFGNLLKQEEFGSSDFALDRLNSPRHRTNFNFTLQGEVPLFNAFQTISAIRASKWAFKASQEQAAFTEMEARLLATEAYLRVLSQEALLKLADAIERSAEADIQQAKDLTDQGLVLGADFYSGKVIASGIRQLRNQVDADLKAAGVLLNILMGEEPEAASRLAGTLPEAAREGQSVGEWITSAYDHRPDLVALEAALQAQHAELFRERASALPRISAFGSVEENTRDWSAGGESFLMGLRGAVDLADPSYGARVGRARAALAQLQHDEAALKDAIASSIVEAHAHEAAARANLPLLAQAETDARQAAELTEQLYREGRKSIADLLEMRMAHLKTAAASWQSRARAETAYAQLLFLSGQLDASQASELAARLEPPHP